MTPLCRSPISVGTLTAALFAVQAPASAFMVPRQTNLPTTALRWVSGPQHHTWQHRSEYSSYYKEAPLLHEAGTAHM